MSWSTLDKSGPKLVRRVKQGLVAAAIVAVPLAVAACGGEKKFKGAMLLGGQKATTEQLDQGYEVYVHYCRACHGDNGDGHGNSSTSLRPPPRDFRQGMFKFGSISGGMPSDEDLKRIIRYGLKGTAMLPWDLTDEDLKAVVVYIKTFSPKWQPPNFKQGDSVFAATAAADGNPARPAPKDTWTDESSAIERGKYIYHVKAQCGSCHPNYVSRAELSALTKKATGQELDPTAYRPDMYGSVLKESNYTWDTGLSCDTDAKCTNPAEKGGLGLAKHACLESPVSDETGIFHKSTDTKSTEPSSIKTCKYKISLLPPDFTMVDVRSVRMAPLPPKSPEEAETLAKSDMKRTALDDLYRVIAGGIFGTPMPTWKGTEFEKGHDSDEDIWAMAHYVYSLLQLKGTPAAVKLQLQLRDASNVAPIPASAPPLPAGPSALDDGPAASASAMGSSSAAPPAASSAAPSASSVAPAASSAARPMTSTSAAKPAGSAKPAPLK